MGPADAPSSIGAASARGDDEVLQLMHVQPVQDADFDLVDFDGASRAAFDNEDDSENGGGGLPKQLSTVFDSAAAMAPPAARPALGQRSESADSLETAPEPVQVMLRLRPLPEGVRPAIERRSDGRSVCAVAPAPLNQRKEYRDPRVYSFTTVLDGAATQQEVYATTSEAIVRSFVEEGKSGLIFTFGVTSSGKSYTALGTKDEPGLIPRALEQICQACGIGTEREVVRLPATHALCRPVPSPPVVCCLCAQDFITERKSEGRCPNPSRSCFFVLRFPHCRVWSQQRKRR